MTVKYSSQQVRCVTAAKKSILDLFNANIRNKEITLGNYNNAHNGKEGHWLEERMGIKHNSNIIPDINGYEMKKDSNMITFGDWSPSWKYIKHKNLFIKSFGSYNTKRNHYSWSGKSAPSHYNEYSYTGQWLECDNDGIKVVYDFDKDSRYNKKVLIPMELWNTRHVIALWKKEQFEHNIINKFGGNGFFICIKENNVYSKIGFGGPFTYTDFISAFKDGQIKYDCGATTSNSRPRSLWRAPKTFWMRMVTEIY